MDGREVLRNVIDVVQDGEVTLTEPVLAHMAFGVNQQSQAETSAEARLTLVLEALRVQVTLTSAQVEKLTLAAGRLRRGCFWTSVRCTQSTPGASSRGRKCRRSQPICTELRKRYEQEFLGADSLFRKTLKTMLTTAEFDRVQSAFKPSLPQVRRVLAF